MFGKRIDIYDSFLWFDIMGYIGRAWQFGDRFRMFFDVGLGIAQTGGYHAGYGAGDINLGIGYKIGKK